MKTQEELGLTFDSVAQLLGYDLNALDECAIENIENELADRQREYEQQPKCKTCKTPLIGKNAIDVGYCIPCFHEMMAD